jgi:hypothetical protein
MIMSVVDQKLPLAKISNKKGANPYNLQKNSVLAKFVFPEITMSYINDTHDNFLGILARKFAVKINTQTSDSYKNLAPNDAVCVLKGPLKSVQNCTVFLLRRAADFGRIGEGQKTDRVKMLIPTN